MFCLSHCNAVWNIDVILNCVTTAAEYKMESNVSNNTLLQVHTSSPLVYCMRNSRWNQQLLKHGKQVFKIYQTSARPSAGTTHFLRYYFKMDNEILWDIIAEASKIFVTFKLFILELIQVFYSSTNQNICIHNNIHRTLKKKKIKLHLLHNSCPTYCACPWEVWPKF